MNSPSQFIYLTAISFIFGSFISSCKKETINLPGGSTRFGDYLSCSIISPPADVNLNAFYQKYLNCNGIPIVSSSVTSDAALYRADSILRFMLVGRDDVRNKMINLGLYMGVIGDGEATTDMPEYAYMASDTTRNWTTEPIGLFWSSTRMALVPEANLMCLPSDLYGGIEDLTVHEFTHPIDWAFRQINSTYESALADVYDHAMSIGLWSNTYVATNDYEYLAEGVQMWYNVAAEGPVGGDGNHNEIDTRAELQLYDSQLYDFIEEYFNPATDVPVCN